MGSSFDGHLASWQEGPRRVRRAETAAEAIPETPGLQPSLQAFGFGAGIGLPTQVRRPHLGQMVLVEPSAGRRRVAPATADAGPFGRDVLAPGRWWVAIGHEKNSNPSSHNERFTGGHGVGRSRITRLLRDVVVATIS